MRTAAGLLDEWALEPEERGWCIQVLESTAGACRSIDDEVAEVGLVEATRRLWHRLGEIGVFEFAVEGPARALELALISYELGRHRAPGPVAATIMAAGALDDEKERAAVAAGDRLVSAGSGGVWPWLPAADIAVHVEAGRLSVGTAVDVEEGRGLSGQPWARATVEAGTACPDADGIALGLLAVGGYLCGLAERTLDVAVAYAAERRQFGQPILRFQDVGHRLADARAALTASEQLLHLAARTLGTPGDEARALPVAAHAAASAADSAVTVARVAHQTLGAYGFTDESPLAALGERIQEVAVGVPGKGLAREIVRSRLLPLRYADVAAAWLTADELAFRAEVRDYAAARRPPDGSAPYFRLSTEDDEAVEAVHEELGAKGWLTLGWPAEHGGAQRSPVHELLLFDALAEAGLARPSLGASVVAGAIIRYGSDSTKAAFLPGLGRGTLRFALGLSEAEAGSDLRNVRLAATPVDGGYVLQGTKVWTSNAHRATHLLALARDAGGAERPTYSVFVVPASAPGLRVRRIGTFDGGRLNEVQFDNVLVAEEGLVGSPGDGFAVLAAAFEKERHLQFLAGRLRRDLIHVVAWLAEVDAVPRAVLEHELAPLADRVAECEATALHLARQHDLRLKPVLAAQHKLRWGETCQAINRLPFDLGIPAAGFAGSPVDRSWRQSFNETIGGGTSEMMRRIIARSWTAR